VKVVILLWDQEKLAGQFHLSAAPIDFKIDIP
jgi:hypothetical protein